MNNGMTSVQNKVELFPSLLDRWREARCKSDELFDVVAPDAFYHRPIPERHRLAFYLGHLEAFDWNLLGGYAFGLKSFHAEFDKLFAFGIDPVGGGLPTDQPSDWPSLAEIRAYVEKIRGALDEKLEEALLDSVLPGPNGFPLSTFLNVTIEHRLMHAETLACMFPQCPLSNKIPQPSPRAINTPPVHQRSIQIPPGTVTLGLSRESGAFGWDNEFEAHTVETPAFAIDQYKVTNRDYLEFIAAGGYEARA